MAAALARVPTNLPRGPPARVRRLWLGSSWSAQSVRLSAAAVAVPRSSGGRTLPPELLLVSSWSAQPAR